MRNMIFLMVFLVGMTQLAFAQKGGKHDGKPRERLRQWVQFRMVEELNLSEEQSLKFFPRFDELHDARKAYGKKRREHLRQIDQVIKKINDPENPTKDELTELETAIEAYKKGEDDFLEEKKRLEENMFEVLTPVQKGVFLIFKEKFEHELREMIRDVRRYRHNESDMPPLPPE